MGLFSDDLPPTQVNNICLVCCGDWQFCLIAYKRLGILNGLSQLFVPAWTLLFTNNVFIKCFTYKSTEWVGWSVLNPANCHLFYHVATCRSFLIGTVLRRKSLKSKDLHIFRRRNMVKFPRIADEIAVLHRDGDFLGAFFILLCVSPDTWQSLSTCIVIQIIRYEVFYVTGKPCKQAFHEIPERYRYFE